MQPFKEITRIIAPLPLDNVDTDMLIPKQFLKTIKRTGLGKYLFQEMRFDLKGEVKQDFVLNKKPFNECGILISGTNFGCGSSREHAVWALADFGIKVVIAPSFADIFYNNCFKNGLLPIALPRAEVLEISKYSSDAPGSSATVNLEEQKITLENSKSYNFEIDATRKKHLLEGLDDIALTLKNSAEIQEFEKQQQEEKPWLYKA